MPKARRTRILKDGTLISDGRVHGKIHKGVGQRCKLVPDRVDHEPGRNDPCTCGSGRKFKRCCGGHRPELTDGVTASASNA